MISDCNLGQQQGAVLPLVGLALAVLVGFGALVVDVGALFVARTELQSALDSCALAAAQELDGAPDALGRATSAGLSAGNANKVGYQGAAAGIVADEVTFSDTLAGSFSATFVPVAKARYARCSHKTGGIKAYLMPVVGGASSGSVESVATATRTHAQSVCAIPVGLKARAGFGAPHYGFQVGEWVTMLYDPTSSSPSEMGWRNLDGSTSADETKAEMAGTGNCGARLGDKLKTPGAKVAVDDQWNARFGIYKNHGDVATLPPDYTGYAYTSANWKNAVPQNAYDGEAAAGSDATAANFKKKRADRASYADSGTSVDAGDKITGLKLGKGAGYKALATPGAGGDFDEYGQNRRIVIVPVIDASSKVVDFACMLMLQPIGVPTTTVQLEYRGNAGDKDTPCMSYGVPGGTSGPFVATLVQ